MSQSFGKTWWGQQWLNSLNNIDHSNRLPRGSSYARKGAVQKISINENRINAKVAGSRPKPYSVDIILPPFFDPELGLFLDAMANKPVIISKLLNRDLDPEVLTLAEQMGLKVFPKQWTDFKMQCSCPDWAVPCKHLAAVIYKVSAEIDNDPFLVFRLHNVDLIEEMNKRGVLVSKDQSEVPSLADLYFFKGKKKKADAVYDPAKAYHKLSYNRIPSLHEPLAALLSDLPPFYQGTGNFKEKYTANLGRLVKDANKLLKGKISIEHLLQRAQTQVPDLNTHSRNKVRINEKYEAKVIVNDQSFSFSRFIAELVQLPTVKLPDHQPSTASLHSTFHFALHLLACGAVVPQIVRMPDKTYQVRWLPAMLSKEVRELTDKLQEMLPPQIFVWQQGEDKEKEINNHTATNLLSVFITELIVLMDPGYNEDVFTNLFFAGASYAFNRPGEESLCGGIMAWTQKYFIAQGEFRPQIVVEESLNESFLLSINILQRKDPLKAPVPLQNILRQKQYESQRYPILQALTQLSGFITGLDGHINNNGENYLLMDNAAFTVFLFQMIPAIRLLDVDILLPKELQEILKPKRSLKMKKKPGKTFLRLDQLLEFDWQIAIGDSVIDEKEFKKLLKASDGLLKYKGRYIYVNKDELEKLHRHFASPKDMSPLDLLRIALDGEYLGAKISLTSDLQKTIDELISVKEIPLPQNLNATLRPYQERGYSWLYRNARIGFGSVIADDMGLGKTLQVITTLLKYKEDGLMDDKKALVVAPTGLLTNWQAEIEKFAPGLKSQIFHGTDRTIKKGEFDILLTSYGIARREAANLNKLNWHSLVLDEAQHIKNNETAQAKAVKSIKADNYIAMSGTPVENRLSELWSIIDYSNRGLLGNQKDFQENYGSPIETYNDAEAAARLKRVTAPFMMRRLKTDRSIISDLPDKIEIDSFATLVKEQASLYEKTLEDALKEIEAIDDKDKKGLFVRQGLVLQMILALKQVCNHPTQYLKNKQYDASLSGKLDLLFTRLDDIMAANEKVLLFTQFTGMGDLLQRFITDRYNEAPLYYHGGCSLKQRKEMMNGFQHNPADKIFILSLKAAGTGLNLTAANHVIHYDLWWNPAVEAQATDRAYRIGQQKNVMVHRFITKNTFEERINEMIQSKKALAEMTVASGENWIGNLSNKELKELFEMR
jgi:SNF2 family DNA or RNA helicase/uncharacterized Zn finger protein